MRDPDQQKSDRFMLILTILIGVAVRQIALAGSEELAATQAAPTSRPDAVIAPLTGSQVYNEVCIASHTPPGVGGAPHRP